MTVVSWDSGDFRLCGISGRKCHMWQTSDKVSKEMLQNFHTWFLSTIFVVLYIFKKLFFVWWYQYLHKCLITDYDPSIRWWCLDFSADNQHFILGILPYHYIFFSENMTYTNVDAVFSYVVFFSGIFFVSHTSTTALIIMLYRVYLSIQKYNWNNGSTNTTNCQDWAFPVRNEKGGGKLI